MLGNTFICLVDLFPVVFSLFIQVFSVFSHFVFPSNNLSWDLFLILFCRPLLSDIIFPIYFWREDGPQKLLLFHNSRLFSPVVFCFLLFCFFFFTKFRTIRAANFLTFSLSLLTSAWFPISFDSIIFACICCTLLPAIFLAAKMAF